MVSTILGRKLGMTQIWDEDDNVVPVTVIQAGPCTVSQVKTKATDGYDAVQIGFGDISAKHVNKPMAGHFKAARRVPRTLNMEITAALVKDMRERTGLGMMECKKALIEGDVRARRRVWRELPEIFGIEEEVGYVGASEYECDFSDSD